MTNLSIHQQAYLKQRVQHKRLVRTAQIVILILFLGLWQLTASLQIIDSFIFSSPSKIIICFATMAMDYSIFMHIGITLLETLISFTLVILFSIGIAILLWLSDKFSEIIEPYLVILNSLPKSALAPLLIVWLGANMTTIIVAAVSVAVFGSIINLYTGFTSIDPDKIKLIYTLGGNKKDVLFKVVLPGNILTIISIMKVNIGLCLVGVVIGEFLAARRGLGYLIIYGSQVFRLDYLIMSICILCLIAILLYKIIGFLEKKYAKGYSKN